jgi:hypothetical protein
MVATILYENDSEKRQHLSAIHVLASTFGVSEDSVRQLYEDELQSLVGQARIRDFLSVLVIRRLKEKIGHQSL